jgi:hypothetical protein
MSVSDDAGDSSLTNRRVEQRYSRDAIPAITGIRLSPGDDAGLVNLSASGILVESAMRYAPGVTLTVHFEGSFPTRQIKGRVVRCQVSAITRQGALQYQTALAFERRLDLGIAASEPVSQEPPPQAPVADAGSTAPTDEPADPPEPFNRW